MLLESDAMKKNKIRPEIKFVVFFLILISIFYIVYYYTLDYFSFLKTAIANLLAFTISLIGIKAIVQEDNVLFGSFAVRIVEECTAVFASLIYISSVLAYPSSIRSKLIGIGFGIPVIQVINLVRLVVLSLTGLYYPAVFEFVHTYIWQSIFIVFVIATWLFWLEKFVKGR